VGRVGGGDTHHGCHGKGRGGLVVDGAGRADGSLWLRHGCHKDRDIVAARPVVSDERRAGSGARGARGARWGDGVGGALARACLAVKMMREYSVMVRGPCKKGKGTSSGSSNTQNTARQPTRSRCSIRRPTTVLSLGWCRVTGGVLGFWVRGVSLIEIDAMALQERAILLHVRRRLIRTPALADCHVNTGRMHSALITP
jgi:hypothetical protein